MCGRCLQVYKTNLMTVTTVTTTRTNGTCLPSLTKLYVTHQTGKLDVNVNYDDLPDELKNKILEEGAFMRVNFLPGTAGALEYLDVPMPHNPNPIAVNVALLFLRGVGGWESSPIVRNAGFHVTRTATNRPLVVARPAQTYRVSAIDTPWKVPAMELSVDPSTPTIMEGDLSRWKTIENDTITLPISSTRLESLLRRARPTGTDLPITLRALRTRNNDYVYLYQNVVAIAAHLPSTDMP